MKSLFEKGFGYRSFMLNQPKEIRARFMNIYIPMEVLPEHRALINSIAGKVRILGVVEGTCPDSQRFLPVLEKLISTNNNIELKLLTRDYLSGELEEFERDGQVKLPTFIFMDEEYGIKGAFIEKPETGIENAEEGLTRLILNTVKQ